MRGKHPILLVWVENRKPSNTSINITPAYAKQLAPNPLLPILFQYQVKMIIISPEAPDNLLWRGELNVTSGFVARLTSHQFFSRVFLELADKFPLVASIKR